MKKNKIKKQRGFTIIEIIMAIAILSIALVAFIPLTVSSIKLFQISKQRHIAAKIAQEGMEFAINKKENHVLCAKSSCIPQMTGPSGWQYNLLSGSSGFEINPNNTDELKPENRFHAFTGKYICLHNGKYDQCHALEQPISGQYTRKVIIEAMDDNSINVKSIVEWGDQNFKLETILFNS